VESELFGHEKGAFTGADRRKVGHIEAAHGGTLFLDEIGELSPEMQVKLLRVLETRTLTRVGGTVEIPVDVRLLSATHRDLRAEIKAGRFREDLYFRLCAFSLHVPPLRERPAEITLLAELFARECAARIDAPPPVITREAAAALAAYAWPGNVRELRNAMEHAIVVAEDDRIDEGDLPAIVRGQAAAPSGSTTGSAPPGPMKAMVEDAERRSIEDALAAEGGNQTRAAKRLGISRRWLIHKMERYGLGRPRKGG
jgi:DNA-binding NtrC family response regulator